MPHDGHGDRRAIRAANLDNLSLFPVRARHPRCGVRDRQDRRRTREPRPGPHPPRRADGRGPRTHGPRRARHGALGGGADRLLAHHALRVDRLLQSDRSHDGGRTAPGRRGHDRPRRAELAPRRPHLRGGLDPRRIAPVAGRESPHPTRRRAAIRPLLRARGDGPARARADDGHPDLLPRAPPGRPPLPRRPGTERPRGPALRDAARPVLLPPQCGGGAHQRRPGLGGGANPAPGGPQSSGRGRPRPGGRARWPRTRHRWGAPVGPGGDDRLLRGLDPLHHRGARRAQDRGDLASRHQRPRYPPRLGAERTRGGRAPDPRLGRQPTGGEPRDPAAPRRRVRRTAGPAGPRAAAAAGREDALRAGRGGRQDARPGLCDASRPSR